VRPTAVIQRQNPEFPKDHVAGESSRSAVGDLVSPREEVSCASVDVVIDGLVALAARSIAEVGRPAAEEAVEPVLDFRPWLDVAGRQIAVDLRLDPFDTFRRWTCA
jgi:hypothetical protein